MHVRVDVSAELFQFVESIYSILIMTFLGFNMQQSTTMT
jgi:hypothetical protein